MSVALTIATTDYDHFRDFRLGLVRAEGIAATWLTLGHHEIFSRFTFNREWDVSELSFAKFLAQVTRPDSDILTIVPLCLVLRESKVRNQNSPGPAGQTYRRAGMGAYCRGLHAGLAHA